MHLKSLERDRNRPLELSTRGRSGVHSPNPEPNGSSTRQRAQRRPWPPAQLKQASKRRRFQVPHFQWDGDRDSQEHRAAPPSPESEQITNTEGVVWVGGWWEAQASALRGQTADRPFSSPPLLLQVSLYLFQPISRKCVTLSRHLIYSFVIWDTTFSIVSPSTIFKLIF